MKQRYKQKHDTSPTGLKRRRAHNAPIVNESENLTLNVFTNAIIAVNFPVGSLSDYHLFRIIISALFSKKRAEIYSENFDKKSYILKTRIGKRKPALLLHKEKKYYAIVCNTVQLHGQKDTIKQLITRKRVQSKLGDLRSRDLSVDFLPSKIVFLQKRFKIEPSSYSFVKSMSDFATPPSSTADHSPSPSPASAVLMPTSIIPAPTLRFLTRYLSSLFLFKSNRLFLSFFVFQLFSLILGFQEY